MMIKSTQLETYMQELEKITPKWVTVKTKLSRNAIVLYHRLSLDGHFRDFLMTREFKSGRVHLMKLGYSIGLD